MIDIANERLLTLAQAAALLPDRPSVPTIWRWRTKGRAGRKLESVRLGGKCYTSAEALMRFAEHQGGIDASELRSPAARERAIRNAEKELNEAGV